MGTKARINRLNSCLMTSSDRRRLEDPARKQQEKTQMPREKEPNGLFLFPKRLTLLCYRMLLFLIKASGNALSYPNSKQGHKSFIGDKKQ